MTAPPSPSLSVTLGVCVWMLALFVHLALAGDLPWLAPVSIGLGLLSTILLVYPFVVATLSRPRIEGTWWGELKSNYADPVFGRTHEPIPIALVIRQAGTGPVVCLHSRESSSLTITASLIRDIDDRVWLAGLYRNEPRLPRQDTSRMHHGGIKLHVIDGDEPRLSGTYWTDRNTSGELVLHLVDRRRAHDFVEAAKFAGVQEPERPLARVASAERALIAAPDSTEKPASSPPKPPGETLQLFLQTRFTDAELRQFVVKVATRETLPRLPPPGVPPATFASEVVDLFHRDNLLVKAFDQLLKERPECREELRALRLRFDPQRMKTPPDD